MRHIIQIASKDVICQSCWVDRDGDIVANIGVSNMLPGWKRHTHYEQIRMSGDEITFLDTPKMCLNKYQISGDDFREFIKTNFDGILHHIITLCAEPSVPVEHPETLVQLELI